MLVIIGRCLALGATEGVSRGLEVSDTGAPVSVPVGEASLGRIFNVLGDALDDLGDVNAKEKWPIHRPAPTFEQQSGGTGIGNRN